MTHRHEKPLNIPNIEDVLRKSGFRVTKPRVQLLTLLQKAGQPLTVQKVMTLWQGKTPDIVTIYRSLSELNLAGIVQKTDLNTGIAHFEYTPDRPHHHHIICNHCGTIEEIADCSVDVLERKVLSVSKKFKSITSHNLEFFGDCLKCARC